MGTIAAIFVLNLYLVLLYIKGPWRLSRLREQHPLVSSASIFLSGFIAPIIICVIVVLGIDSSIAQIKPDYYDSVREINDPIRPFLLANEGIAIVLGIVFKFLWVFDEKRGAQKQEPLKIPTHN